MSLRVASALVVAIVACVWCVRDASAHPADTPLRETAVVARAVELVPDGQRLIVKVVDPDLTGDPETIRRLDAFVVRERNGSLRQTVYLNRESALFQAALRGSDLHVTLLAAVIYHEACHLRGFDESRAALAERSFLEELMDKGVVSRARALPYLELMRAYQPRPLHAP